MHMLLHIHSLARNWSRESTYHDRMYVNVDVIERGYVWNNVYERVLVKKRGSNVWDEVCIYRGSHFISFKFKKDFMLSFSFCFYFLKKDREREGVRYEEENVGAVSVSPIQNILLSPWLKSSL